MSKKEALKILMQSPFYFRLTVRERKELIEEFIAQAAGVMDNGFVVGID